MSINPIFLDHDRFIFPVRNRPDLSAAYEDPSKRKNYLQRVVDSFIKNEEKALNREIMAVVTAVALISFTALAITAVPYIAIPVASQIVLAFALGGLGLTLAIGSGIKIASLATTFKFNFLLDNEKAISEVFDLQKDVPSVAND